MQKREQSKVGGGGSTATPAKRGRPVGSVSQNSAAAVAAAVAESIAPSSILGPSLQIPNALSEQNSKRLVLALQSGLKSELIWAFNALTLLSFKEKEENRRDAIPLARIPGLLDAVLQIVDDWRDIGFPKELQRTPRVRLLGVESVVSGFGSEYEAFDRNDAHPRPGLASSSSNNGTTGRKDSRKHHPSEWWFDEDELFNLDEEGRTEKQQCAVAASNIIRNLSYMQDNETIMAQHRHCLETVFKCIEDHATADEELVTNALETIVSLAPLLDLRIFSSSKPSYIKISEKRAVQAIMGIFGSSVKAWHCAATELLGRLIINPDNEPFLLPFAPQMYKRLVDLLSLPATEGQAAAVGALYNLSEVSMDCRLKLASERWAVDRLLKVIRSPHPVPEICKKAAMILESLVSEPQNRNPLLAFENVFAEILFMDGKHSEIFARILYELTARPANKIGTAHGIWGMST